MITQYRQGLFELILFDVAMGSQVAASGASRDKVFPGQEGQGSRVIVVGEMYLGEPKGVGITIYSKYN